MKWFNLMFWVFIFRTVKHHNTNCFKMEYLLFGYLVGFITICTMQSLVGVPWWLAVALCMLLDRMLNPHRAVGKQDFSALTHRDSSSTQLRTERCFFFFFSLFLRQFWQAAIWYVKINFPTQMQRTKKSGVASEGRRRCEQYCSEC